MNLMSLSSIPIGRSISRSLARSLIYGKSKLSELYPTIISTLFSLIVFTNSLIISLSSATCWTKSPLFVFFVEITLFTPKLLAIPIMMISSSLELGIPWGFLTSKSKLIILKLFGVSFTLFSLSVSFISSKSCFVESSFPYFSIGSPVAITSVIGIRSLSIRYLL